MRNRDISVAVDTLYCRLIRQNLVQGYYVFPFATSLSHHAMDSLIQSENKSLVDETWNFYRRLMWIDSDPEALMTELEALVGPVSPRSRACGLLWSKMIDAEFLHALVARAQGY